MNKAIKMQPDLSASIGDLRFKNCVTVCSGTFACGQDFADFYDIALLGAVTTKGISAEPWEGNACPRIAETASGMLNSIGLQNPGVEAFCAQQLPWLKQLRAQGTRIIVNVSGHEPDEYARVIDYLEAQDCIDAYELNISCPNLKQGGMTFGTDPKLAAQVTHMCRLLTKRPLIVKLTPNVSDIVAIARACVQAGADALSLVNTVLGMAIDVDLRRPKLACGFGGLSGPAIKPIAVRCVWQVHAALPQIPLIGMGGIMNASDALEFILAGASLVALGSANFVDPKAGEHVYTGLRSYCLKENIEAISSLVGISHCL